MDDELRYKEYKSQIPPKWLSFDEQGLPKHKRGFAAVLRSTMTTPHNNNAAAQMVWDGDDGDGVAESPTGGAGGKHPGGKKRTWEEEMIAYVREQEVRNIAKEKSQKLEEELKRRQERANAQREKQLAAAVRVPSAQSRADGDRAGPDSVHSSAVEKTRIAPRAQKNDLICAAMELETTHLIESYEDRLHQRYQARAAVMAKHIVLAEEKQRAVSTSHMERSAQIHEHVERMEQSAHRRLTKAQEAKQEKLIAQIKASEAHSRECEERLRLARIALNEHRARLREEADRRIEAALEEREQQRIAYEKDLEVQIERTNDRLLQSKLEQEIVASEDRVGKALARAEAERQRQRAEQLAACERAAKHRERVLRQKEADDAERQQRWQELNRSREQRSQSRIDSLVNKSIDMSVSIIKRHHSPSPVRATPSSLASTDMSKVAADVAHHLQRHEDDLLRRMEEALELEKKEYEKHQAILMRQKAHLDALHHEGMSKQEKRNAIRARAAAKEQERSESISRDVQQRAEKSEKHLSQLRTEIQEYVHSANAEKTQKARAAIELVQVTQRQELLKCVSEKEKRIQQKMEEREAIRQAQLDEQQAAQRQRWEETMRHIAEVERSRDESLQSSLAKKDVARAKAAETQEDKLRALQDKLQKQTQQREAALAAQELAQRQKYLKSLQRVATEDQQWSAAREAQLRAEREYLSQRRAEADAKESKVHKQLDKTNAQKLQRTVDQLEANYARDTVKNHLATRYEFHPPRPKSTPA